MSNGFHVFSVFILELITIMDIFNILCEEKIYIYFPYLAIFDFLWTSIGIHIDNVL